MRIIVCIKQVPSLASLRLDPETKRLRREAVPLEVNSFDVRALAFATQLRTKGDATEVVAITLGPPSARAALEYCLALGADQAVHLSDPVFAGSDVLATARALASLIEKEPAQLILCGRYSVDAETAQLGPELATLLSIPFLAQTRTMTRQDATPGRFHVECETDDGILHVTVQTPFLATVTEDIATERFPSKEQLEEAKRKPIVLLSARDTQVDPSLVGEQGSPTRVEALLELPTQRYQRMIDGPNLAARVSELVRILTEEHGMFRSWRVPSPPPLAPVLPPLIAPPRETRILVIGDPNSRGGERVTLEILGRASQLAEATGGSVAVVFTEASGRDALWWGSHGVDRLFVIEQKSYGPTAGVLLPEQMAGVVSRVLEEWQPTAALFPSTWLGRNTAAIVAARHSLGLSADCIDLGLDETGRLLQYKPAFGGAIAALITSRTSPAMATVRPGVFPLPEARNRPAATITPVPLWRSAATVEIARYQELPDTGSALDQADVVVGVGKGVLAEDLPRLREFGSLLGAPLCTTRDVVDEGRLPRHLQVGLTGRSIAPKLYIAVGIRGAYEHVVGFRRAGIVVAINRNPKALIFRHCDYGLVADYREAIPLLQEAIAKTRANALRQL